MNERDASPIGFFQKYLTVWVILCMAVGICVGKFLPQIPEFLNRFEYARVSIPMAILIWVMIYPMMMKVDFRSIKNVGRNPKGLFVTWIVNWLIKPFTMYGMASLFFFVVFKAFITPELATEYLAGAVLLGAAVLSGALWLADSTVYANPMVHLLSGGMLLGAIYMATDYVTSPMSHRGMLVYGLLIGLLCITIRTWGAYPEGMSFAILIMNAFVPLINRYFKPSKFGHKKLHA